MDVILSKGSQKFIQKLQSKYAKQIATKIKELAVLGHCHDSKKLKCDICSSYYRIDVGEYRIIYQHEGKDLNIILVGKRNDDEVYNLFKRKKK